MIAGMVGGIFAGAAPAQPVPWRLLRLADAREAAWAGAAKVQASAQDADGWITLGLRNNSPIANYPGKMAYRSFAILNPDGSPVDASTLAPARSIVVLLQRDTSVWLGSAAQETVAIGIVDHDGDISDASAAGLLVGMRTTTASSSCSLITGTPTAATAQASTVPRAAGSIIVVPAQSGAITAAGLTEGGAGVAGDFAASFGPTTGNRRIVLTAGCNTTTNNGPHPVRFRAWYAVLPSAPLPWADPV